MTADRLSRVIPVGGRLLALSAVALLAALFCSLSLKGQFVLDDKTFFVENDVLTELKPWQLGSILLEPSNYWGEHLPVRELVFVTEHYLFGSNPLGYHLVSLILYVLLTLLVFRFVQVTSQDLVSSPAALQIPLLPALPVALLFAAHPLHVESFAYISSQKDLLYSIFTLVSMLCFWKYLNGQEERKALLAAGVINYYLALLSKMFAVSLAALIPLLFLLSDGRKRFSSVKALGFWLLVNLPVALWVNWRLDFRRQLWCGTLEILDISLVDRLLRAVVLLGAHTKLALFPWKLSFGYPTEAASASRADLVAGVITIIIAALLVAVFRRNRWVLLSVGIYFLTLAPALQLHGGQPNLGVYDRYLTLPILGIVMLVEIAVAELSHSIGRGGGGKTLYGSAIGALLLVGSWMTISYVPSFRSEVAVTENTLMKFPSWNAASFNHAISLIEADEWDQARRIVLEEPSMASPLWVRDYLLGWIDLEIGRTDDSYQRLMRAASLAAKGGYSPFPNLPLARTLIAMGRPELAERALQPILQARIYRPLEVYRAKKLLRSLGVESPRYSPPCQVESIAAEGR